MKIMVLGGGPGGLFFAILMKRQHPHSHITVLERNRPDDTFGFGVVFSDETLSEFMSADEDVYREIRNNFAYWDEIDVHFAGEVIRSAGHGFCGLSRKRLLNILQRRATDLGVEIRFETEFDGNALENHPDAGLIVAADGINSLVRERYSDAFRPSLDWRQNKFVWLGTTKPLEAFSFYFRDTPYGLFQAHAYQFEEGMATFIVETQEKTWKAAGLDKADEARTLAFCQDVFAEDLGGHELVANRSIWRTFPTVRCESWVHDKMVLIGDAAHTAHFSIGSGTKLAMEDAITLADVLKQPESLKDIPVALRDYDRRRHDEVGKLQHAAQVSLEWFEHVPRYHAFSPLQFAVSLLSRSKRITYENLRLRDPAFIDGVQRWFAEEAYTQAGREVPADPPPPAFTPFRLCDMVVENRIVVSPMCQYSAKDGVPGSWHMVHLGSRAVGGAGLVFTEMTDVSADGRITPGCTGLYNDAQEAAWKEIVDFVHGHTRAKICMQISHAGRKGATCIPWQGGYDEPLKEGGWPLISASPIPYLPHSPVPKAMDRTDMDRVREDFAAAAHRALRAGFDMLEIHMAHGYLLSSFISPATNKRQDEYGGDLAGRMRYPLEVLDAVRAVWPRDKPLSVRISAVDWLPPGQGMEEGDAVEVARMLKTHGADLIDVSSGQTTPEAEPVYGRMYQVPFADAIRQEAGIATMAVGNITSADQVSTIVAAGRADLAALARPHLADPYFTLHEAVALNRPDIPWPEQYQAGAEQAFLLAERARAEQE